MEKTTLWFYLFVLSLLAYEIVNRPLLWLENDGHMNTVEYQVLFQVMIGTLVFAFIGAMELYNLACKAAFKYIHTPQHNPDEKLCDGLKTRKLSRPAQSSA
jgi:hypothetical protein